jgi:hypothetical protein
VIFLRQVQMRAIIQERGKGKDDDDQRTKLKDPILFKDAIGRKFTFPFYLCTTWQVSSP